jgi:small subunit ribosomal protein S20
MPNIKSAIKKVRKDKRRTAINRRWKERYKEAVKKARRQPSVETLKTAQEILDKTARRGVIKKRKASRLKSRLAKNLSDGRK